MPPKATRRGASVAPEDGTAQLQGDAAPGPALLRTVVEEEADRELQARVDLNSVTTAGSSTPSEVRVDPEAVTLRIRELELQLEVARLNIQLGSLHGRQSQGGSDRSASYPQPPMFKGDTMVNCKTFLFKFQEYFKEYPLKYQSDEAKVRHAAARLEGKAQETWMSWSTSQGGTGNITWLSFERFCHDRVEDPIARAIKAGENFWGAKQAVGQSVSSFATYLEQVLAETEVLTPLPEDWKSHALLNKVQPNLRKALWARMPQRDAPQEWTVMLEQLCLAESSMDVPNGRPAPVPDRPSEAGRKRDRRANTTSEGQPPGKKPSGSNRSTVRSRDGVAPGACWNCGKLGHQSKDCRSTPTPKGPGKA